MGIRTRLNPMGTSGTTYYTLTITKGSECTVELTYDGNTITYSSPVDIVEGTIVSYSATQTNATSATGTITMSSNKNLTITKSANGYTLGDKFQKVGSVLFDTSTGYASDFSASKYIKTKQNADAIMSSTAWTVVVKFKFSNVSSRQFILSQYAYSNSAGQYYGLGYQLELNASKKVHVDVNYGNSASTASSTGSSVITEGTWYTVTAQKTSSQYKFSGAYISSTKSSTTETHWTKGDYHKPILIGYREGGYSVTDITAPYLTVDLANSYLQSGTTGELMYMAVANYVLSVIES